MNEVIFLVLSCLVAQGSVDAMEHHELIDAAQGGNLELVRNLLDSGADVNQQDDLGDTALHLAPTLEIAELLLDRGAPVNSPNFWGCAPLHRAIYYNNVNIARLLLKRGAFVEKASLPIINLGIKARVSVGTFVLQAALDLSYKIDDVIGVHDNLRVVLSHNPDFGHQSNIAAIALSPLTMAKYLGCPEVAELLKSWPLVDAGSRASRLAFCMAMHPRVGANSSAHILSQFLFQDYTHIHEQQQTQSSCTIC